MTDFLTLMDRNRTFAEEFRSGDLAIRPRLSTFILTCLDARVDPAHVFRLGLGDAIVMRNGGGWVTPAVLRDLAILGALNANLPGGAFSQPQLVVIHHTDCGMGRLANPPMQEQLANMLGIPAEEVGALAIIDPASTVEAAIERLRSTPGTPDQLVVSGLVYDVTDGTMSEIVSPAPLRQS